MDGGALSRGVMGEARFELDRFVRVAAVLADGDPCVVVLGELCPVASWSRELQVRFVAAYADVLAGCVASGQWRPLRLFFEAMSSPSPVYRLLDVDGRVAADARDRVAARLGGV